MTGIYIITNKTTGKQYIGQSNQVEKRLREHQLRAFRGNEEKNKEWDKPLYRAIRKHGVDDFLYEILEECSEDVLAEREAYYINLLQTNVVGYNITSGYEYPNYGMAGEQHPNSKLTEQDVKDIREAYAKHEYWSSVYERYSARIGHSGFKKIWNGATWKNVSMEVYTPENKAIHRFMGNSNPGEKVYQAKLTDNQVREIRLKRKEGLDMRTVYEEYKHSGITYRSFQNVWHGCNWKHIIV